MGSRIRVVQKRQVFKEIPSGGDDEMVGDVAADLDQRNGQPLAHDVAGGEEEYHDAQEEVG